MKIISKFRDYYDIGMSVGIDPDIKYIRETIVLPKNPGLLQRIYDNSFTVRNAKCNRAYSVHGFIIGFCGKIYKGIYAEVDKKNEFGMDIFHIYNEEEAHAFLAELIPHYYESIWSMYAATKKNVHTFFNAAENANESLFYTYKTPVFAIDTESKHWRADPMMIINPVLSQYQFFKVIDSFTAFQELSMYISGVLGQSENPTLEVSEKVKVASKGFDEWSFRNPSPGRKKRKQKC